MAAGKKQETMLRTARLDSGLTQEEMSELTGIPLRTYRRLEAGAIPNPGIRYLTNCALAMGLNPWEVVDAEYETWFVFNPNTPKKPSKAFTDALWNNAKK